MARLGWSAFLVSLTPLAIAWVEISRQIGGTVVAPFLLIFGAVAIGAATVGLRAALFGATLASLYTLYSAWLGFGPSTLTGGPLQLTVGVVISFCIAVSIGHISEYNKRLIAELDAAHRRLTRYSASLEAEVAERTADYRNMTRRAFRIQDMERAHLARELHDEFGQLLVSLKLSLRLLRTRPEDAEVWNDVGATLDSLLEHTRTLSLALHPAMLDRLSLAGAIRRYLEQQAARSGLAYTEDLAALPPSCPQAIAMLLYRCVQEAVNNVIRHADATRVGVVLSVERHTIELTIEDDGKGFDVPEKWRISEQGGLGLPGMQERLHLAGGELDVESSPGSGTRVCATIDLDQSVRLAESLSPVPTRSDAADVVVRST